MVIVFLLVVLILIEGVGTIIPRGIIPYFYFALPSIIFFYLTKDRKSVYIPTRISIIFAFFLFFSFVSAFFFSVNKQISFELVIFYFSAFLVFVFFYNYKELARKYVEIVVFAGSIIFTAVYFLKLNPNPVDGYQLVAPFYANVHNHLGDFLGLGLIFSTYSLLKRKEINWSLTFLLFLPLFLFSFSRTGYLALSVTLLFLLIKNRSLRLFSIKTALILALVILSVVFFFGTVREADNKSMIGNLNRTLARSFDLKSKNFTAGRLAYFKQGMRSLADKPLFGVGPGNFSYSSKKYMSNQSQWYEFETTDNAHSLSLDILFENGTIAFVFFGFFVLLVLANIYKKNSLESYLLLYLLINFQTDYSYKIYSVFVLFMALAAVVYEEKESDTDRTGLFPLLGVVPTLVLVAISTNTVLLKNNLPLLASYAYPLSQDVYKGIIADKVSKNSCGSAIDDASKLYFISSGYLPTLQYLSRYYEVCGDQKKAISMLDEASSNNRFISFDIVKKNYLLKKRFNEQKEATKYLKKILLGYDRLKYDKDFEKQVADFCFENGERACQELNFGGWKYFYEPDPKSKEKVLKQIPYPEEYTINEDTLNERFDYTTEKAPGVFRIMTLGDSSTFGLLVKTKDNWTERLEDLLNQNNKNHKINKIEVINLAVHGYDMPYEVERFRKRGVKYNPDLVLWFVNNSNFSQLNEVTSGKSRQIEKEMKKTGELDREIAKGNYYPVWEKANEETKKEIGGEFLPIIKSHLESFRQDYPGKVAIVGPALEEEQKELFIEALGREKTYFYPIADLNDLVYRFPKYGQLNELGHSVIAGKVSEYLKDFITSTTTKPTRSFTTVGRSFMYYAVKKY